MNPARADWGLSQATKDLLRNYVLNIRSHRMTQKAIDEARLYMVTDQFLKNLDVSEDASNLSITIQAKSRNPEEARLMAQTLADIFVAERRAWNQEQDKSDRIEVSKVDDIRYVPLISPNWKINTLAGALFGLIAGGLVVFFLEWLESDMLRSSADVQKATGIAVLGAIPAGAADRAKGQSRGGCPRGWNPAWPWCF